MRTALLLLVSALTACEGSIDSSGTREVDGRVDTQSWSLSDAAVLAHAADGRVWVAPVVEGRFTLTLPVGLDYRLLLVEPIGGSSYRLVAHVTWPTGSEPYWAHLSGGDALGLGSIEPECQGCGMHAHDAGAASDPSDPIDMSVADLGHAADGGKACDGGGDHYGGGDHDGRHDGGDEHDGGNVCDGGSHAADGGFSMPGVDGGMASHGHGDAGCHEDDGATACGTAPDGHCTGGGTAGVGEHVDDQKCQAAEQHMNAGCK
jgi:hypothetical protein